MKFYPYSPYDFTCQQCGAKAGSRCIVNGRRTWDIAHKARFDAHAVALRNHGPMPVYRNVPTVLKVN